MKFLLGVERKQATAVDLARALIQPGANVSVLLFDGFDPQNYWLFTAPNRAQLLADVETAMRTHKPDVCLTFDEQDDNHPQLAITAREVFVEGEDESPWEVIHYHGEHEPFHEGFETFEDALNVWLNYVPWCMVQLSRELHQEFTDVVKA